MRPPRAWMRFPVRMGRREVRSPRGRSNVTLAVLGICGLESIFEDELPARKRGLQSGSLQ